MLGRKENLYARNGKIRRIHCYANLLNEKVG
jgi:hypothetical protein